MKSSRKAVPRPSVMYVTTSMFTSKMLLLVFYAFFFGIITNLMEVFIYCLLNPLNCEPPKDKECDLSLSMLHPDNKGPAHKICLMNM